MNFLIEKIGDETLVLDCDSSSCHCLSAPTALVWQHLRTQGGTDGLEKILQERFGLTLADARDYLEDSVEKLAEAKLIEPQVKVLSRRKSLKWMGGATLLTAFLPHPAAAASGCALNIVSAQWGADLTTSLLCGGPPSLLGVFQDRTATLQGLVSNCSTSGSFATIANFGNVSLPGVRHELRVIYSCNGGPNLAARFCENSEIVTSCP